jgi:transposase-like protein
MESCRREQSPGRPTSRRNPEQEKAAAVRMVRTLRAELGSEQGTVKRVAEQLGYGVESVRLWVRQADIDDGHQPGVSKHGCRGCGVIPTPAPSSRRCDTASASPSSAPSTSIGSVGDSFDNALAETVNGYYKTELIRGPARHQPWKTVEEVELATLSWVHWHNQRRLHGYLDDTPPVEYEQRF